MVWDSARATRDWVAHACYQCRDEQGHYPLALYLHPWNFAQLPHDRIYLPPLRYSLLCEMVPESIGPDTTLYSPVCIPIFTLTQPAPMAYERNEGSILTPMDRLMARRRSPGGPRPSEIWCVLEERRGPGGLPCIALYYWWHYAIRYLADDPFIQQMLYPYPTIQF